MKINKEIIDNIEGLSDYSHAGSWNFLLKNCYPENLSKEKILDILKEINDNFSWITFKNFYIEIITSNQLLGIDQWDKQIDEWKKQDEIKLKDWFKKFNFNEIEKFLNEDITFYLDLEIILNGNNKLFPDNDAASIYMTFDKKRNNQLLLNFEISTNIFTEIIWMTDTKNRGNVLNAPLGKDLAKENRVLLKESLMNLERKLNAEIIDFETESVTKIHKYGFTETSEQFRF